MRPVPANPKPIAKWFCLEGHILVKLNDGSGQSVELSPGQMVVTDGTYLPEPSYFDIAAMVNSSPLMDPPPASMDAIQEEIQRQQEERIAGTLIDANAFVSLDRSQLMNQLDQGHGRAICFRPSGERRTR